jgi:hypothetical protein
LATYSPTEIEEFSNCAWLSRVEIPATVVAIHVTGSFHCISLTEVCFSPNCWLEVIDGFSSCHSLVAVAIPASAFDICDSLTTVTFAPDSCLELIRGFSRCHSLLKIEIPASVEQILFPAFDEC